MNESQYNKLIVLVERHLVLESQLAEALDGMNQAMTDVLSVAGLRGPTQQDVQSIAPITDNVRQSAAEMAGARKILLDRINAESQSDFASIKAFVVSLPPAMRARLDGTRDKILDHSTKAQASLVQNQASLYYTFDFHRKYLSGVLQGDLEGQSYGADGQTHDVKSGNIIGKTC